MHENRNKNMKPIIIKRIYEKASDKDGYRILVDRIWPRGVSKDNAKLDEWKKEIAPSTELRKWFDHKEKRFDAFVDKYKKELEEKKTELQYIKNISKKQQVCLLYGAKNEKYNQAVVLKEFLDNL